MKHPFPRSTYIDDIITILGERVICEERFNNEMKIATGCSTYNVYDILSNTHGVDVDDFTWFKLDNKTFNATNEFT